MKKKFLSVLLSAAMVVSLCACGSKTTAETSENASTEEEGTTTSETAATTQTASTGLKGHFSIYHFHEEDGSGTSKAFWDAAKKFQEANPDVQIDYIFADANNYQEKLTTYMAGDELADVWLTKGDMLPTFADGGLIQSADQYISKDTDWSSQYVDGAFTDSTYDDKQWGVPFQMQANCVGVYNQAIFEECGIDEWPETWTELLADCEKIKAAGYTPIGMGNKDQWLAESAVFNTYAYKYVDQDWFNSLANNQGAKFTDEKFVKALDGFQNIAQYFNSDMNSIDQDEMYSLYYNKKCAMFFNGAWSIGTMIANCPEEILESTHVGLMPAVEGEAGTKFDTAAGAGWNYVINSKLQGDDLTACLAFLKAVTTGEYADDALSQGFISAAKTTDACDMSSLDPLFSEYYELAATMNNNSIFDCVLPAEVGSGVLYADTQQLISNSMTAEEMAADCQSAMEANYER
ncbi:carbohydrate ABC transporter substrate-binding protein (CUT1 family) [Lachnotalea glycerini]|uniref:Carbohydrate ABC transporter substrate-binding protein (CUT1 family) n=1 Tax=Lachnotalea glycerini TaxID=1763509 RepID=A0A318EV57_9FIRM|nr:extracellular solute-binding protein [Lachnotalea glycerini]PXV93392.1 carbohydrate ABC transporter substrate-binding protein (CUT1 family) [Lachnotalea glycerini]